jgi:DNA-binding MarR family transcriptional regulator
MESMRVGSVGTPVPSKAVTVAGPGADHALSEGEVDGPERAETEMASRLRLAVTRLHRRLRQHAPSGLSQSQSSALASIDRLGSPTLGALAARESVQPPSMTRIVAGLESLGYVTRIVDPADRRVARVTISAEGQLVLQHSRSMKNAFLAQQLHRLSPEDRHALGALTTLLEQLVEMDES